MRTALVNGWRQLLADRRRHLLPVITLALAVAMLFGSLLSAQSANSTLSKKVDSFSTFGQVGVVPASGFPSIDEESGRVIERLSSVRKALPTFSAATVATAVGANASDRLTLTGYPTVDNSNLTPVVTSGRLPNGVAQEVLVPTDVASRLGVKIGDEIALASTTGRSIFVVSGLADPVALGLFAHDNIFVALDQAQRALNAPGQVTRIDLDLDTARPATWTTDHVADLPRGTKFQDTTAAQTALEPIQSALNVVLDLGAVVILLISVVLVGLAFRSAIEDRQTTLGLLRTVGASGVWLVRGLLVEAVLVASFGTFVGLALGYAGACGGALLVESPGTSSGSLPQPSLGLAAGCIGIGLLAGPAGAARAVIQVFRHPPLLSVEPVPRLWRRRPWLGSLSVALFGVIGLIAVAMKSERLDLAGYLSLSVACAVAAPFGLRGFAVLASHLRGWKSSAVGRRNARERSLGGPAAIAAVVVCASTSLCIGIGAIGSAMEAQVSRQFGADVQATTTVPLTDATSKQIKALSGVAAVAPTVSAGVRVAAGGRPLDVSFLAVDPKSYFSVAQLPWHVGDDTVTPRQFAAGDSVILPVAVAESLGTHPGSRLVVSRGSSSLTLRVIGTFSSLATGNQIVGSHDAAKRLGFDGASGWNIKVDAGHNVSTVRDRIAREFENVPGSEVVTGAAMKATAIRQLAGYSSLAFLVVAVALIFGALGASAVLASDVVRRQYEFAILRAVGARPRDVRRLVLGGTGLVLLAASTAGLIAGWPAGVLLTRIIGRSLGVAISPTISPFFIATILLMTTIAMLIASLVPARVAARTNAATALRKE